MIDKADAGQKLRGGNAYTTKFNPYEHATRMS